MGPVTKHPLHLLVAVQIWTSCLTFLCHTFFSYRVSLIIMSHSEWHLEYWIHTKCCISINYFYCNWPACPLTSLQPSWALCYVTASSFIILLVLWFFVKSATMSQALFQMLRIWPKTRCTRSVSNSLEQLLIRTRQQTISHLIWG